jgi:hypothetical protein
MGSLVEAGAGQAYTAADAATLLMQQGLGTGLVGTAGQTKFVTKSRVPLFSSDAQLAAQEQLATGTAKKSAVAAGAAGGGRSSTAAPASTAGVGAAAVQDAAACWNQAHALQHQSSSTLTGVLARAMTAQEPAVSNNQQHGEAQQQQVQQAAVPASPHMQQQQQQQQQQAQMQLQQGSWMSSSSSSAVSSSAAGGAALGGLMSPSGSITGHLLSPGAAAAHRQLPQGVAVTPVQDSQGSRQWQCSSSAVPSYTAGAEAQAAAAAAAGATDSVVPHATAGLSKSSQHPAAAHAAGLARSEATRAGSIAVTGAVQYSQRVERAAPGPADSQIINQHRQHILTLEQSLGNMHPQVRQRVGMSQMV